MEIRNFTPRNYQKSILETAIKKNTLVVLPTGMGKTAISLLLAKDRLDKYPKSKIIICSPSKPLASQHYKTFEEHTNIKEIALLTGATPPKKRKQIFEESKIITATPQTIQSDLKNERISLENVSMLCIDEAHRSRQKYANTIIAKIYQEQSEYPRILALTASPGGTKSKIKEICENLFIDAVEIRTYQDEEIRPHIQKKELKWIKVELPNRIKNALKNINEVYKSKIDKLKKFNVDVPKRGISKKHLLALQERFRKELNKNNPAAYYAISLIAQIIKIGFLIELLETQTTKAAIRYFEKLKKENTKAAREIIKNERITKFIEEIKETEHPKIKKLKEIIVDELKEGDSKIIIFANYRNTVDEIVNSLKTIANPVKLIGQKEGVTQKQQIQTVKEFASGKYNVLVGTSITEEGLDISGAKTAIMFDQGSGSEIRKIQRMGRVARLAPGKIIYLITKGTRDEALMWASHRKEKIMQKTLKDMQESSLGKH